MAYDNRTTPSRAIPSWLSCTGLVVVHESLPWRLLGFVDSILRGIGQVMLQNNSYAGLLFLIGIFYNSWSLGWAVLFGTTAGTVTAILLRAKKDQVQAGLFGFNGALVAIALAYFLHPSFLTFGYMALAAACSTICMAALLNLLKAWEIPALTAPFVFITVLFILATARFGHLHSTDVLPTAGLPKAATVEGIVTASTIGEGLFKGVAQVFFQNNTITGILFVIGLLISSRIACMVGVLGSLIGLLMAWRPGAAEPAIRSGAFGFNSVLTAIALAGGYFPLNITSISYCLLAVIVTPVVFAAMSAMLEPLGMPTLTFPFVMVVWFFLLASPLFSQLHHPVKA